MKRSRLITRKQIGLMFLAVMLTGMTYAATFTASSSGNFSSTATWAGGVVPPTTVLSDQIIIQSGVTVNLDNDLTINGILSELNVQGTLSTADNASLTLTLGKLSGAGTIALSTVSVNAGSTFSFTGTLTANTFNATTGFQTSADIVVTQTLNLTSGTLSLVTGGSLDVTNNGTIVISGGSLSIGTGGSVGLTGNYNVKYTGSSTFAGIELNGSGLQNVTIDVNSGGVVTLVTDLTVAGTLSLTSGILVLAGNNLTLNGTIDASGSGSVSSSISSNVSINTAGGSVGTLTFNGGAAWVNNLTINVGTSNIAFIGGNLTVNGTLQLVSGVLDFGDASLTINGPVNGSGIFYGNTSSNFTVSTSGGLSTALSFATSGQSINNFTVSVGNGNSVALGSSLTVNGTLALNGGSNLSLNGNSLTMSATSDLSGFGSFVVNSTSNMTINSTAGISSLTITGTIGNLTINSGSNNVTLGSNLAVGGTLTLQSGALVLSGFDLSIFGNVAASGNGTISSTFTSDVNIMTSATVIGSLRFTAAANTVGNLVIGIGNNGWVSVASDLNISDSLRFTGGKLNMGSYGLMMGISSSITGTGNSSYIITANGGYVQMFVTSGASGSAHFPVGTVAHYAPANVRLNTGSSSGQVQVGVTGDVMENGTTGADLSATQPLVDATWNVSSGIVGNLNMNLQVMWSAAMEVNAFNRNAAYISHHINGNWDTYATAAATAEAGGMYSLQRTGITALSPFAVFDQNTNSVNELDGNLSLEVYPNPATDYIRIRNSSVSSGPLNVDIYDAKGQLMEKYELTEPETTFSMQHLVNGNYYLRFYNNRMSTTKSFIKM